MPVLPKRDNFVINLEETKWNSQEEAIGARILSYNAERWINEIIKDTMIEKVNLPYDPGAPESFKFQHEYLRGFIAALSYLVECSKDATEKMIPPELT